MEQRVQGYTNIRKAEKHLIKALRSNKVKERIIEQLAVYLYKKEQRDPSSVSLDLRASGKDIYKLGQLLMLLIEVYQRGGVEFVMRQRLGVIDAPMFEA